MSGEEGASPRYVVARLVQFICSGVAAVVVGPNFIPGGVVEFPKQPAIGVAIRIVAFFVVFFFFQIFVPRKTA